MPRKTSPSRAVAVRLPEDIADALDALVATDPGLSKTEAISVSLHSFMSLSGMSRMQKLMDYRVRLYGGMPTMGAKEVRDAAYPPPQKKRK